MSQSLQFVGRILSPVALKAAARLAGPLGLTRRRIEWRVRSATGLLYPRREYRAWLKSIPAAAWSEPVESAAPRLTMQLDAKLSEAGPTWEERSGRASAALRLVIATYDAVMRVAATDGKLDLLAAWDRHRNEEVLSRLEGLATSRGGWGLLDGPDLAFMLDMRSWARRTNRLQAIGVPEACIPDVVAAIPVLVPRVGRGEVRHLVGPFGSGKSEVAEEWHRVSIEMLRQDPLAAIPLWISARNLRGQSLESAVSGATGTDSLLRSRGVALVVDGLDEVGEGDADALAQEVRVLVAGSPLSSALITARPDVLLPFHDDIDVEALRHDDVLAVIRALGGPPNAWYSWPSQLQESTKTPFFAIAAALMLVNKVEVHSRAGLIKNLVEHALRRGKTRSMVAQRDLFEALVSLAVTLSSTGSSSSLGFQRQAECLSTRLVVRGELGDLQFALPIFEQWFCAQYLVSPDSDRSLPFADGQAFGRWRWSLAVALSGADPKTTDDLMGRLVDLNPGAASWVIKQVTSRDFAPGAAQRERKNQESTSAMSDRLASATRRWIASVGDPLATMAFDLHPESGCFEVGLRIHDDGAVTRAWREGHPTADTVFLLPDDLVGLSSSAGWYRSEYRRSEGSIWPWTRTHEDILRSTKLLLESRETLGGERGVWMQELRYDQCRIVLGEPKSCFRSLDRALVIARIEDMLKSIPGGEAPIEWQTTGRGNRISGREIDSLRYWLRKEAPSEIRRPAPGPDLDAYASGFVWGNFSREQLTTFALETYGLANQAYDEVAASTFSRFGWSLGYSELSPIGTLCLVTSFEEEPASANRPAVSFIDMPLSLLQLFPRADSQLRWSTNGRAVGRWEPAATRRHYSEIVPDYREELERWRSAHPAHGPFARLSEGHSRIDVTALRPASALAARRLHDDLRNVGLGAWPGPKLSER